MPQTKTDVAATPPATLVRSRAIALAEGVRHVYTGNVHDRTGGTTFCPGCTMPLIVRDWHEILDYGLTDDGSCRHCGTAIPGRFERYEGAFGSRRIPIRMNAAA